MRREDYERTYGRRSHMPPPQEDPRSRRSRRKMKCLISIGLILPALAAVIGVAAWAVSADVVMNSGNNRGSKVDNSLLQNYAMENQNRRDRFNSREENQIIQQDQSSSSTTKLTTTQSTTTSSTTSAPATLSPQEENDVNAIISKLISASGAATGGNGPRFVVVAPLPDNSEDMTISRVDKQPATKPHPHDDSWHASGSKSDLLPSSSSQTIHLVPAPSGRSVGQNLTSRIGYSNTDSSTRRMGSKTYGSGNNYGSGSFNNPTIELTGFEPFDSMMIDLQTDSQSNKKHHSNPSRPIHHQPNSFNSKRGPPQGHFNHRNPSNRHHLPLQHFDPMEPHVFHHMPENNPIHHSSPSHPQGIMVPPHAIGLKPIQQQLHHGDPMRPDESRWGSVAFHAPPPYVHKPQEGISLAISSPANSGTHVSSEPVSVIKSFFLPFLPKPRLNMNARVVFGVVLDKGMGLGGDKKKSGIYH